MSWTDWQPPLPMPVIGETEIIIGCNGRGVHSMRWRRYRHEEHLLMLLSGESSRIVYTPREPRRQPREEA